MTRVTDLPKAATSFATASDGVRLAVYEWGNPSGPELLLIHGFAQCHLCFLPQLRSPLARLSVPESE